MKIKKGRPSQHARRQRADRKIPFLEPPISQSSRVNAPSSKTDVVFAILMLLNLVPFLTCGRDGSPVPETSIAIMKITSLVIASGISASIVSWQLRGYVNRILMFGVGICIPFAFLWVFAAYLEVWTESNYITSGTNEDCIFPSYSTIPRNILMSCVTFFMALYFSSSFY